MKLIVELIYERKAITSLCETIEKRLNQIEKIDYAKFNDQKIKTTSILTTLFLKISATFLKLLAYQMNASQIYSVITKKSTFQFRL